MDETIINGIIEASQEVAGQLQYAAGDVIKNINIVNGSKTGSLRTVGSAKEGSGYEIGDYAFAEGYGTTASSNCQHVQGKYNIPDSNNSYVDIVGNGSSDTERSNAHTLDWNGNAWYARDVYVGSTSGTNKDDGSKKLATEEYIDTQITEKTDQIYNPNSQNAQSGKAVLEAIEPIKTALSITESASGKILNITDASPIQHDLKIQLSAASNFAQDLFGTTTFTITNGYYGDMEIPSNVNELLKPNTTYTFEFKYRIFENGSYTFGDSYNAVYQPFIGFRIDSCYTESGLTAYIDLTSEIPTIMNGGYGNDWHTGTVSFTTQNEDISISSSLGNTKFAWMGISAIDLGSSYSSLNVELKDMIIIEGTNTSGGGIDFTKVSVTVTGDGESQTVNANQDGSVTGLKSYPKMTITANNESITNIFCEYIKDLRAVINELQNAIISLGGNV